MSPIKYAHIVFQQEHDAEEAVRIYNEEGPEAVIKYLSQWDYGEYHHISDESYHGTRDKLHRSGDYILSYNPRLPYIGLEKMIKEE